jgi:hypothetical protein
MFHRAAFGAVALSVASTLAAAQSPRSGPVLVNLGFAGSPGGAWDDARPRVGYVFAVGESAQGGVDLNGDGDALDWVPHFAPLSGSSCSSMGRALGHGVSLLDEEIVFAVSEAGDGGLDLNGDGDLGDAVPIGFDLAGTRAGSSGLAAKPGMLEDLGAFYFFELDESVEGIDLNGDGDTLDDVLHYVEPPDMSPVNLRLVASTPWPPHSKDLWTIIVSEFAQGADLDGDGLLNSQLHFLFDGSSHSVSLAPLKSQVFAIADRQVIVLRKESEAGLDLNADGDLIDWVVHVLDFDTGALSNTGLASSAMFGTIAMSDRAVAVLVDEEYQGAQDLNGDGDAQDVVLHTLDLASGIVRNSGLARAHGLLAVTDAAVLLRVSEAAQGAIDLNGDGDVADAVLHAFDAAAGAVRNSGLASSDEAVGATLVATRVAESDQGASDLNGDGDALDDVRHVFHWRSGVVVNPGVASPFLGSGQWAAAGDDWAVFTAGEQNHGATDLNGDGDALDTVLFLYDHGNQSLIDLAVAVSSSGLRAGDHYFVSVRETSQGATDLNGDGDSLDNVVHRLDVS